MSVNISSFQRPKGTAMSFSNIGDFIDGDVFDAALVDDIHNVGKEVLNIKVSVTEAVINSEAVEVPEDTDLVMEVWCRRAGMQDALGESVGKAGCDSIDVGARLRIEYVGDKVLPRTGRSMKLYAAIYEPAGPIGTAVLGDEPAPF
jgi:hypothetical protein